MSDTKSLLEKANPCPFCGRTENLTVMDREYYDSQDRPLHNSAYIKCEECWLMLWFFDHGKKDMTYEETIGKLVDKWNRRYVVAVSVAKNEVDADV